MKVYEPGQVKHLLNHLPEEPDWFLLGGPADACEAQDVRARWPSVCIAAFEPNPFMYNIQVARGFPGLILPVALWDEPSELTMKRIAHADVEGLEWNEAQSQRSAAIGKFSDGREWKVKAETLDRLSEVHGPFTKIALWLDIESAEIHALRGAENLFRHGQVLAVNTEQFVEEEPAIVAFLASHGLHEVHRWNRNKVGNREWCNAVYARRK